MACGTPLTASRPALVETCGDAALLFDPLDKAAIARSLDAVSQAAVTYLGHTLAP